MGVADVFAEAVVVTEVAVPPITLTDELEDRAHMVGGVERCDARQPLCGVELRVRLAVVASMDDASRGPGRRATDEEANDSVRLRGGDPLHCCWEVPAWGRVVLNDQEVSRCDGK